MLYVIQRTPLRSSHFARASFASIKRRKKLAAVESHRGNSAYPGSPHFCYWTRFPFYFLFSFFIQISKSYCENRINEIMNKCIVDNELKENSIIVETGTIMTKKGDNEKINN